MVASTPAVLRFYLLLGTYTTCRWYFYRTNEVHLFLLLRITYSESSVYTVQLFLLLRITNGESIRCPAVPCSLALYYLW
jgi:hypothetical protein